MKLELVPEGARAPIPLDPAPEVGDEPEMLRHGGVFPIDEIELSRFTDTDILNMMNFYNETFGISPQDNVQTRRSRICRWLKGTAI